MSRNKLPELLMPAGNLEKLKTAIQYGADAVYVGGEKYGLRARADNFSLDELRDGTYFCHQKGKKIYVVLNAFLHDKDMLELPPFIEYLDSIAVDAVIVADIGVLHLVKEVACNLKIHLSTQSCCLNSYAANFWKECGVERIVLGREVSIDEAARIKKETNIQVEMFVHGSMCISYSGNCIISNYTAARDSNRGGCAHSCRFQYLLKGLSQDSQNFLKSFFMSSKDLMGIRLLPLFYQHGIDSLKVEGRMKSQLYVGTVAKAYRLMLDTLNTSDIFPHEMLEICIEELRKVPHRDYTEGNLLSLAQSDSIYYQEGESGEKDNYMLIGQILRVVDEKFVLVEVKNAFSVGDQLEIIQHKKMPYLTLTVDYIYGLKDKSLTKSKPNTIVKIRYIDGMQMGNIIRKKKVTTQSLVNFD